MWKKVPSSVKKRTIIGYDGRKLHMGKFLNVRIIKFNWERTEFTLQFIFNNYMPIAYYYFIFKLN